jgi:hypothetical protein
VARGFYWSEHLLELRRDRDPKLLDPDEVPTDFLGDVIDRLQATFYTVDVAATADGRWMVTDVNDGQMSGLSDCNPYQLYSNLWKVLRAR